MSKQSLYQVTFSWPGCETTEPSTLVFEWEEKRVPTGMPTCSNGVFVCGSMLSLCDVYSCSPLSLSVQQDRQYTCTYNGVVFSEMGH